MPRRTLPAAVVLALLCACPDGGRAFGLAGQQGSVLPAPAQGGVVLNNFHFRSGETMEVTLHYRAFGKPQKDAQGVVRNAVLIMHGTGGTGAQFTSANFAGELFGPGQLLDVTKYYVILPDDIGHGESTKPSTGLRAKFPKYGYLDMIEAEYRLLTEGLGVNHARLVMGTSMGGMHTWLWGEEHPDFMDALMPLASLPTQIAGRNRVWRRVVIDAITGDPEWKGGNYTTQPQSLRTAAEMLFLVGDNPVRRQRASPTLARADQTLDAYVANYIKSNDANDVLYALSASLDYDPGPKLEHIKAPLLAINFADDLINPPELGILEKEITRVPRGRAVVVPFSDKTAGHGTHTLAAVWKQYLEELLEGDGALMAGNTMSAIQDHYPDDYAHCYGCGRLNRHGLHVLTEWTGTAGVSHFQPRPEHMAMPGFVYGGLIASLIDCHGIGTAAAASMTARGGRPGVDPSPRFVTVALEVQFLKPTPLGPLLELRATPATVTDRKVIIDVSVRAGDLETVRGRVVAVPVPASMVVKPA